MRFGERPRGPRTAIALIVGGVLALLAAMLIPGAGTSAPSRDWRLCRESGACRPVDIATLGLAGPTSLVETVYVGDPRPELPLAVHITAMASAELRWNGVPIGRNGVVGPDRARETPGRFDALFPVPPDLVRPGPNILAVRLSAHHLWAPVARPIHRLSIGPYDGGADRIFVHYLPTLVVIGLLLVAFAANLALWLLRRGTGRAILALLAGTILLQAAIETSKLALAYPYPWQLARLAALAGLATLAALLITGAALAWVGERRVRAAILLAVALGAASAWLFLPWWDAKLLWAFRAGLFGALAAAAIGTMRALPGARLAALGGIVALVLSGLPGFLDLGYYLVFVVLFAREILAALRAPRTIESAPPVPPDEVALIVIPNGGAQHRVALRDILHVRADDDYSIVHLVDGRALLATINLAALLRLAPGRLLRVHRSHAINPENVAALHRAGKPARTVELAGGLRLPVGRTYWGAVVERLAGSFVTAGTR